MQKAPQMQGRGLDFLVINTHFLWMNYFDILSAVIVGNALTISAFYGIMRAEKLGDWDFKSGALWLLTIGVLYYSMRNGTTSAAQPWPFH